MESSFIEPPPPDRDPLPPKKDLIRGFSGAGLGLVLNLRVLRSGFGPCFGWGCVAGGTWRLMELRNYV